MPPSLRQKQRDANMDEHVKARGKINKSFHCVASPRKEYGIAKSVVVTAHQFANLDESMMGVQQFGTLDKNMIVWDPTE